MELPVELLRQGITRGSVLLSDCFEDIDHAKFFAVIGIYEDRIAGFFFINSRIHPIIQAKPKMFAMQYLLRKNDYDFLRYDSFLGANELQTRLISVLIDSMQNGQTSIVGQLTEKDLSAVLEACRNSELFTAKEKRQFFY
ncbi:MAG: hypothetical protein ACI3Y2_03135 [Candidatus Egerieousia sp.]